VLRDWLSQFWHSHCNQRKRLYRSECSDAPRICYRESLVNIPPVVWAVRQQTTTNPGAKLVLACLAAYSNRFGCGACPSVASLCRDSHLSERWVRSKLVELERLGLIVRGNQDIAEAKLGRRDRLPIVYDLVMEVHQRPVDNPVCNPVDNSATGCTSRQNGVHVMHPILRIRNL
jgi:Helix-turn-helix domain